MTTPRLPGSRSPHPSGAESGRDVLYQLSADPRAPPRPWPRRDPAPYGSRSVAAAAAFSCVPSSLWLVTRTGVWLEAQPGQGQAEPTFTQPPVLERSGLGGRGQEGTFQRVQGSGG